MTMVEAKVRTPGKLGGKPRKTKRGKMRTGENRLRFTPVGYLRAKKVSGHKYYYYCEAVKQPDGSFKEQCEYLGTAKAIRDAVRAARTKGSGSGRA